MCPSLKNLRFPPECQENFSTHISQRRNIKTSRTRWKTNAVCIRVGREEEGGGRIKSFIFSFRMTSVSWMLEMCKWVPINNIILLLSLYPCKHVSLRLALYLTPTFVSSWPFVPYRFCSRAHQFTYLLWLNCCSCSVLWNRRFRRNTHTHMHTLTHAVGVDICIMGIWFFVYVYACATVRGGEDAWVACLSPQKSSFTENDSYRRYRVHVCHPVADHPKATVMIVHAYDHVSRWKQKFSLLRLAKQRRKKREVGRKSAHWPIKDYERLPAMF